MDDVSEARHFLERTLGPLDFEDFWTIGPWS